MRWPRWWMWGALAAWLVAMAACDSRPAQPAFHGVDITGASYAQDFHLPDTQGRVRSLSDFKGKVVVVFFGYTQCPDVCPTTMAELAQAKRLLGQRGQQVQGIFITLDPERDSAQLLDNYVRAFDPSFIALRADLQQTRATAQAFRVFFEKVPGADPGQYTVDHTAGSFVFDAAGRARVFARYGMGAQALSEDLAALLKASPSGARP